MNVNFKLDGEQVKKIGKTGLRITKAVGIAGVKSLLGQAALKTINSTLDGDMKAFKNIDLDYIIGEEKPKGDKPKKKWFSKKEKEEIKEIAEEAAEETVEAKLEKAKQILEEK